MHGTVVGPNRPAYRFLTAGFASAHSRLAPVPGAFSKTQKVVGGLPQTSTSSLNLEGSVRSASATATRTRRRTSLKPD